MSTLSILCGEGSGMAVRLLEFALRTPKILLQSMVASRGDDWKTIVSDRQLTGR